MRKSHPRKVGMGKAWGWDKLANMRRDARCTGTFARARIGQRSRDAGPEQSELWVSRCASSTRAESFVTSRLTHLALFGPLTDSIFDKISGTAKRATPPGRPASIWLMPPALLMRLAR